MHDDLTLHKEASVLKKLRNSFGDAIITGKCNNKSNAMMATELANGLYSVDEKLVPPILGFVLMQYLENHPDSLGTDDGFVSVVYFLRGAVEDILDKLKMASNAKESSDRMQALAELSIPQLEAITEWIDIARCWPCCQRFRFDLEEAKTAWSRYLVWRERVSPTQ